MLKPRSEVAVEVKNTRVVVEGRLYEGNHVLIIGASKASLIVEPDNLQVKAFFKEYPSVDIIGGEVIKVYKEGAKYQVDMFGDSISSVEEEDGVIRISGEIITIKFDRDEDIVNVIIPKVGKVTTRKLEVSSDTSTSINMVILPFTIGVVNIYGRANLKIKRDVETTIIEASRAKL